MQIQLAFRGFHGDGFAEIERHARCQRLAEISIGGAASSNVSATRCRSAPLRDMGCEHVDSAIGCPAEFDAVIANRQDLGTPGPAAFG